MISSFSLMSGCSIFRSFKAIGKSAYELAITITACLLLPVTYLALLRVNVSSRRPKSSATSFGEIGGPTLNPNGFTSPGVESRSNSVRKLPSRYVRALSIPSVDSAAWSIASWTGTLPPNSRSRPISDGETYREIAYPIAVKINATAKYFKNRVSKFLHWVLFGRWETGNNAELCAFPSSAAKDTQSAGKFWAFDDIVHSDREISYKGR